MRAALGRTAFVALLAAMPAASEAVDVFAAYTNLRTDGANVGGGALGATWGAGALRLVVEGTGQFGNARGEDVRDLTLMAGPVLGLRAGRRLQPFVHARAGVLSSRRQVEVFGVGIGPDGVCDGACPSRTGLAGEAGGGLDVAFGARWALRLPQVDYRIARVGSGTARDLRVSAGLVFRPGR